MPGNLMNISAQSQSNNISSYIPPSNDNNNSADILDKILLIKNNTIERENVSHTTSQSWSINRFLSKIKDKISRKQLSQPAVDIELNKIIAQGRKLSRNSDTLQRLLQDKQDTLPSSNLSITTKTGIVLAGMLLSGALVGGGVYYYQRTGREQHNKFRHMSDSTPSPASPYSSSEYNPFYSHAPEYIHPPFSKRKDTNDNKQENNELIHSKFFPLIIGEENQSKKIKRHNVPHPLGTKINQNENKVFYAYSNKQPEPCLTDSFNQLCQRSHNDTIGKQHSHSLPYYLAIKIENNYCICPPPDWLEITTIAPSESFLWLMNRFVKPQPTAQTTTSTPLTPMIPAEINITQHYISQANTVPPKKLGNETKPLTYENERENMILSTTLRRISKILESPGSEILTAGKTALDQEYVNNTQFYQTTKKVETAIDNILMWIPMVNRIFISATIVGDILNLYSDALEGKEMDRDTLTDLVFQITNLSKDIISSVNTADLKSLSNDKYTTENKKFLHPFFFKKNNLMMIIPETKKKIKIDIKFNHLYTPDTNEFIFYDNSYNYGEGWKTDEYKLNDEIENTFKAASKIWKDPDNIYFFKNSSPPLYSNGIILRYHGELYLLINDVPHKIDEIAVKNGIYRYLIKNDDKYIPVTYGKKSWVIEESSSPLVSDKLCAFLDNNHSAKNNLVSTNINHQDVSPLTSYFMIQFDKKSNRYLKINDKYYMIKTSMYGTNYIEGPRDLLELQYTDHQYHIKNFPLDDICCFHKIPINTFKGTPSDPQFFLDITAVDDIRRIYSLDENKLKIGDIETYKTMRDSKNIDGAIKINSIDYIFSDDLFAKIQSNGDDTYILGDPKNDDNNILTYKNQFGDTYFKIPKTRKKWQHLIEKPTHCITKRQPMGVCAVEYYESHDVDHLLEENSHHSIIINDYQQQLVLHDNLEGIYQEKRDDNNLYYKRKDNKFFHARKDLLNKSSLIPSIFIIYGKNTNQQINLKNAIARICIVKDFDTKKIIFSTPEEAQDIIFNIPQRLSKLLLKTNEQDRIYRDITPEDLVKIKEGKFSLSNSPDLKELFHRSGKKTLSSIEQAESILKSQINDFLKPESIDSLEINDLKNLEKSKTNPVIEEICNNAFKKASNNIEKAISTMEHSDEILSDFITKQLGILDTRASEYFSSSFKSKLERIKMFFNEDNKKNIMIITKKKQESQNNKILTKEGELTFGFSILHDPLDRIFINTAIIKDFSEKSLHSESDSQSNSPLFPQPDTPKRNQLFFTNLISDTLIHESVHALGSPDDYLYLSTNKEGYIEDITKSIKQIEEAIAAETIHRSEFKYFSKLYFMSNPLYQYFTFSSLNKPEVQTELFRQDSFYRAILLLKNPDTISLLIRELANPNKPEE